MHSFDQKVKRIQEGERISCRVCRKSSLRTFVTTNSSVVATHYVCDSCNFSMVLIDEQSQQN